MEISSVQHQAMASTQLMEEALLATGPSTKERKARPQPDQALKCPRCDSTNTKFCYYNNYSLTQPRYFCKGCRRYWTQGGSLRNVPVGGGCRKNKRSSLSSSTPSTSSSSSSNSKKSPQSHHQTLIGANSITALLPTLPPLSYDPSDLSLAPFLLGSSANPNLNPNPSSTAAGFLDILRSGFLDSQANPSGFNNLCSYAFDGSLLPFDGCLGLSSAAAAATAATTTTGLDGENPIDGNNNNNSNVGVDSARDYWNGDGGGYNWHGLINSSLI